MDRRALEPAPGLDVGAVDRDGVAGEHVGWDRGPGELVGEPGRIDAGFLLLEDPTDLDEQPFHPRVGLLGVPPLNAEGGPLRVAQGVQDPGRLDQMGLVVPMQGVQLQSHQERLERQLPGSPDLGDERRPEDLEDPGALDHLARQQELPVAGRSAAVEVERSAGSLQTRREHRGARGARRPARCS